MLVSLVYSLLRALLDVIATSHGDQALLQAEVLALRRQVQVLERQVKRVRWTPGDRMLMAALRDRLQQSAWAGLLVRPETVLGWHRALVRRKWAAYLRRPRRGRPRTSTECRQLIVRMAQENPGWGYFRIKGELRKLGHTVAPTTIRSVLLRAGIPPSGRRARLSWKQFLAAQAQAIVVADFLSVDTVFFKRLYVLIYMHLATRRVLLAACTANPKRGVDGSASPQPGLDAGRGRDQAEGRHPYRDKKFSARADNVLRSAGVRVILTPLMAPRANAHVERWIGSCRRECLDWMLVVNQRHLEAILREYCMHTNPCRGSLSTRMLPTKNLGLVAVIRAHLHPSRLNRSPN